MDNSTNNNKDNDTDILDEKTIRELRCSLVAGIFNGIVFSGCWGIFYGPIT